MRLLITSAFRRLHGGVESYLQALVPALIARGHEIALCTERDGDSRRDRMELPARVTSWSVEELGAAQALKRGLAFAPELVFCHRLDDLDLEHAMLALAPGVFFAHNYYGTCISGTKTRCLPHPAPCDRVFGAACLAQYFPRRCGGLNPATMFQLYSAAKDRLQLLGEYKTVLTNSEHLAKEYRRHGIAAHAVPLFPAVEGSAAVPALSSNRYELLFVGRMEKIKGGDLLLESLPAVRRVLDRDVRVTFAGDGSERTRWEHRSRRCGAGVHIEFAGWLDATALAERYRRAHLLVMPSLWPEPFGLTGLEAGMQSLPTVAFPVGGIPEWLRDGKNGVLAELPASATSLARAIVRALTPDLFPKLRNNAASVAREFSVERHCQRLERELECAAARDGETAHSAITGVREAR
jgi:glycosyltransferase involved in cell wall biosynthesis